MSIEVVNPTLLQVGWIAHKKDFPADSLTFIVKGTFQLLPNEIAQQIESLMVTGDEFIDFNPNKSLVYESDFAYFKEKTDLLLKGTCYTPNQKPMTKCEVEFSVAGQSRVLNVIGDRYALPSMMGENFSDPQEFVSMPISFKHSYGGIGFEENTVGKGIDTNKEGVKWMHNVFDASLGEKTPASFGPINRAWKQRSKNLGTYDEKWQEERWPWFPEDFNWAYFNAADESMQLDGYLNGDEKIICTNLHPEHANYEADLPRIKPRCFVAQPNGDEEFKEVDLNLDTLFVDMDSGQLQLVWRGVIQVKSPKYTELSHVYVEQESLDEPEKSKDDYEASFNVLITPVPEFDDEEVVEEPEEEPVPVVQEVDDSDPFENAINQSKAQMLAAGFSAGSIDAIFDSADPRKKLSEEIQTMGSSSIEADQIMEQSQEKMKQSLKDQGLSQSHIDILFPTKS